MKILKKVIFSSISFWWILGNAHALTTIDQAWLNANGPAPYYLDQQGETYVLQTDVTADGNAFVTEARNITVDLNGFTVTYDNKAPIVVPNGDFENGTTGWTGITGNPQIAQGTFVQPVSVYSGAYAVKFSLPVGDSTIRSVGTVTLEPNTSYSLSAMFYNTAGYPGTGSLFIGFEGTTIETQHVGRTWRGFQYTEVIYKTGSTPETYTIRAGIRGANGGTGSAFIDDIKVSRYRNSAFTIGPPGWQNKLFPDLNISGNVNGLGIGNIIENGTIIQGPGQSSHGHGIITGSNNNNVTIRNMDITVSGTNARNLYMTTKNTKIQNNICRSNVKTIISRDNHHGMVIYIQGIDGDAEISGNTIIGGPQGGIYAYGEVGNPAEIFGNTISLNSEYVNGFGIHAKNANVYNNVVDCTGQYACRGIRGSDGTVIHDNTVSVQYFANFQEGDGCPIGGTYATQLESGGKMTLYNNNITAIANECEAYAFRTNPKNGAVIDVYNNTFVAISNGPIASTLRVNDVDSVNQKLDFHHNIIETNSKWFQGGVDADIILRANRLVLGNNLQNPFQPLNSNYWPVNLQNSVQNLMFLDNIFDSPEAHDRFVASSFIRGNSNPDQFSSYKQAFTTTLKFVDSANNSIKDVIINIKNNSGADVFNGISDVNGEAQMILEEYLNNGGTFNQYNPYLMTANKGSQNVSHSPTIDKTLLITCNIDTGVCTEQEVPPPNGPPAPPPPSPPSNNNAPFVDAGIDQTTTYPNSVFLDGLVTDDGLPNPPGQVTILWTKDTGPGNVNFVDESKEDTYAAFSVPGVYRLLLTADDGQEIRSDDVFITVNQPGGNGGGGGGSPGGFSNGKFINVLSKTNPELFVPCNNPIDIYNRVGDHIAKIGCGGNLANWKGTNQSGNFAANGLYRLLEPGQKVRSVVILK